MGGGYFISIKERKKYFLWMVVLSLFGAFIAYKTLSSVSSIEALQSMMVQGEDVTSLREEMGAGGISGVFKMFACMPLCVFLMSSGFFFFSEHSTDTHKTLKKVMVVSLLALFFKIFIYFDRLSLLAVLLVAVWHFLFNKSLGKIIKLSMIFVVFLAVTAITLLRMEDTSLFSFLGLYFNLGVENLQILIDKQHNFNYDFSQTFLMPLSFVFKFFGINHSSYDPVDYEWNIAQSFWGDLYLDFNYWGILLMPFIGMAIRKIERNKCRNGFCMGFYFIAMYTLFSFCTVPVIRSIEFWLMIIIVCVVKNKLVSFERLNVGIE